VLCYAIGYKRNKKAVLPHNFTAGLAGIKLRENRFFWAITVNQRTYRSKPNSLNRESAIRQLEEIVLVLLLKQTRLLCYFFASSSNAAFLASAASLAWAAKERGAP